MKRLAALILAAGAALTMSGTVHAASTSDFVAGHATLSNANALSISASRSATGARGSFTLTEGTSGSSISGRVLCLTGGGEIAVLIAEVTRSTDATIAVGSDYGFVLENNAMRHVTDVVSGTADQYAANSQGQCTDLGFATGIGDTSVVAGTIIAL